MFMLSTIPRPKLWTQSNTDHVCHFYSPPNARFTMIDELCESHIEADTNY